MELLHNGFTLNTPPGTFPLSTDSMLLAHFVRLPKNARVLDLGSGCGTLGLMLCAKDSTCHITGIELDEAAHKAAVDNIAANSLHSRMESICADIRCIPDTIKAGSFTTCVSNPPYFSGGAASLDTPIARRDDCCSAEDLMRSAAWSLQFGGDLYLVQKPDKLAHLISCAAKYTLETKRLVLVRHKPDAQISMILLHCRKGAKPGLTIEGLCLHHSDNTPTDIYKDIYHIQEAP